MESEINSTYGVKASVSDPQPLDGVVYGYALNIGRCIECRKCVYACAEVCPTGARKFGNLKDPDSEVRKIIERERVYVLKQDLGTVPKFYYVFAK